MVVTQFVWWRRSLWDSNEAGRLFRISILGSYLSHPPNDVIKVQQKSFLLLILILPLFTPQKTNNKSHVSTTFVTMFCQRQYFNEDIEIGRLLKETLADSNARQLVFEGKREKYIFSENVLPTRRKRNLSSTKFICKDRENPFFYSAASSGKTLR